MAKYSPQEQHYREEACGPLFLKYIPKEIKDLFKAACASNGETMTDAITELMKRYIKESQELIPEEQIPKSLKPKRPVGELLRPRIGA